jgi:molybdopterin-guanine dinucleotide biosynthesis protein A
VILGAVLAGGRSTRFGSDKAEAIWKGRPLVEHVIEYLGTVCDGVVICGRQRHGVLSIPDRPAPDLGPLGGLNAALHFAGDHGFDRVISMPCDTPMLDPALLEALAAVTGDAFLAEMPVIGSWRANRGVLLDRHQQGSRGRSMRSWAETINASALCLPAPLNVNHSTDLEALDGPR